MTGKAQLIALMGLPGCGKSTFARLLEQRLGITVFREPEEELWPGAVKRHLVEGHSAASTILFFRSVRVEQLLQATDLVQAGQTAAVDSYYDKLLIGYIDDPAMRWFLDPADESLPDIRRTAASDYRLLPDADIVIFFSLTEARWRLHLGRRGRGMDDQHAFLGSFALQDAMLRSVEQWAAKKQRLLIPLRYDESMHDDVDGVLTTIQNRIR